MCDTVCNLKTGGSAVSKSLQIFVKQWRLLYTQEQWGEISICRQWSQGCIFFCLWFDVLVVDLREFTCFHGKESHRWMFEGENKLFRIRFSSDTVSIIEGAGSKLYCLFCLVTFKYFSTGLASCKQSISHLSDLVLSAGWYISSNVHNIVVSIMFQMPCLRFL